MVIDFNLFFEVFKSTLIIYFGILLGYIFIKSPLNKFRSIFVNFTLNVLTPYLIVVSFLRLDISSSIIFPLIGFIIVTFLGITIPTAIAKIMRSDQPSPAEISTATFSNALNFPYPVIFALAPEGLGVAGIFLALSILARNSLGFWIAKSSIELKNVIKQIIMFPPIWAVIIGFILRLKFQPQLLPVINYEIADLIFKIGIFATLMTVGFSIKKPDLKFKQPIFRVGMTRYIFSGIIGIIILMLLKPPMILGVPFFVQLIAPPAVYNGLYAEKLGMDTELTAQVIVTLTLIALIFLPFELIFLEMYYG